MARRKSSKGGKSTDKTRKRASRKAGKAASRGAPKERKTKRPRKN
jgi:hypothetical protein